MMSLKRVYINVVHQIHKIWWFITRPEGKGVKVVLKNGGDVLLVRHNYGHRLWTVPGGGLKTGEDAALGGRREIGEELGMALNELIPIGSYFTDYEYRKVTVDCFVAEVASREVYSDNFEIAEISWFPLANLPQNRASSVDKIMKMI